MTGISKKNLLFGSAVLLLCSVIIFVGWVYRCNMPAGNKEGYTLDIKPGMSADEIADMLYNAGVVKSPLYFKVISKLRGYSRRYKAGTHELDGLLGTDEIALLLTQNPPGRPDIPVTLIEGLTIREIASILASKAGIDSAAFVDLAMDTCVAEQLVVDNDTLEGYLYPDTYFIRIGTAPMEMIERMVNQFAGVFNDSLKMRAEILGMTVNEVVTLASMIESETGRNEERALVSQVFHRRLKLSRPLESNPTIQYAIGIRRRVLDEDLNINSPYNTYIHAGLPPGPIANPGKNSLLAALYPADSSYLYFVADGKGGNIFSRTLSEHNRAVRLYKRQRKRSSMR